MTEENRCFYSPITHVIDEDHSSNKPLTKQRFDALISIAAEMGFTSIDYDQPDDWRAGRAGLPERPIMYDFDHPVRSMRYEMHDVHTRSQRVLRGDQPTSEV